jgi:diguanylate cyclase (GGDEF)-like protein
VPAALGALLFFMSGGDYVLIAVAFLLIVWSFLANRHHSAHAAVQAELETASEVPDFLRAGLEWCLAMAGAKRVLLWRLESNHGLVRPIGVAGGVMPSPHILHGSPVTWLAREGIAARLEPHPDWAITDRVLGIPVHEETPTHALTIELIDDIDVKPTQFEALGIYMGALLNVVRDHHVLGAYQARTENLIEALRVLPSASTLETLGRELAGAAIRISNGSGAALSVWNGERGEVSFSEGGGPAVGKTFSGVESLSSLAARGHGSVQRERSALRQLPIVAPSERFAITPHAAVAIPLMRDQTVVAVLTVWSADVIHEAAISALETIAPYAATQVQHATELSNMRHLAERDALTELHNRGTFDHHLQAEVARFERYRRPFALIMLDIDHFKKVNDQYGHDAGDEVLRKVAELVQASLRDVDFAARYGGEEFAVLLPETDKAEAVDVAERIRRLIETTQLKWRAAALSVTISAGVAAMPEHGQDPANIVRAADQLLYEAKRHGRNRICHK